MNYRNAQWGNGAMGQWGKGRRGLLIVMSIVLAGAVVAAVQVTRTKSAEGASVYIIAPKNGAKVKSPFVVQFGLKGMGIAPAGITQANTGHHHLLVDVAEMPDMNAPLPNNEHIRHFGGGQTEAELTLPPGKHTLQLLFADATHLPHDKPLMSEKITVTVK
jgi:hypothetical protein